MKKAQDKLDKVLSGIGLKRHMVWKAPSYNVYNRNLFTNYVSSEYLNSTRKETDEAYSMFEVTLIHDKTGLRINYTTTESYDGETVDYKLNNVFIVTNSELMFDVID
ncbi:MAG: hypothetical protein ACXWV9_09850, partial [Flavisolibacter sp.]